MKKLLVMVTVLAMCATLAFCAEVTPKKKGPSAKAYERASDNASFKRNFDSKNKKVKKEVPRRASGQVAWGCRWFCFHVFVR